MTAAFEVIQADILLNRYHEPLTSGDIQYMMIRDDEYAASHPGPLYLVADFGLIVVFPPGLLSLALRSSSVNPIRNPKIVSILVICDSPFMSQLASVVSRVTGIHKLLVVRNWVEARLEFRKRGVDYQGKSSAEGAHAQSH